MNETEKKLALLREPVADKDISWRVGEMKEDRSQGRALPYIDARVVQNRLDEVMGPGNWKNSYTEIFAGNRLLGIRCSLALRIDGEWVAKEDAAFMKGNHQSEDSHERALKGAYSDAEKRAAVQWGIARHLYEFDAPWVDLVDGKLTAIPALDGSGLVKVEVPVAVTREPVQEHRIPEPQKAIEKPATPEVKEEPEQPASAAHAEPPPAREPLDESKYLGADAGGTQQSESASAAAPAAPEAAADDSQFGALYKEMLSKLERKAVTPAMLRNYIRGPKGMEKLTAAERKRLEEKLDAAEEAAKTSKAA